MKPCSQCPQPFLVQQWSVLCKAVANGDLGCVIHQLTVFDIDKEEAQRLMEVAAQKGCVKCLMFVHEHVTRKYAYNPLGTSVFTSAGTGGSLECIKYLVVVDCPRNIMATAEAASNGHLECLQYLHEADCPWDVETCIHAAFAGHLSCLRYAHENGCPLHEETYSSWNAACAAIGGKNMDCLQYVYENGCPLSKSWYKSTIDVVFYRFLRDKGLQPENQVFDYHLEERSRDTDSATSFDHLEFHYDIGLTYSPKYRRIVVQTVLLPKWRRMVRMRSIAVFWQDAAGRSAHAVGGSGRKRDYEAYATEFGPSL